MSKSSSTLRTILSASAATALGVLGVGLGVRAVESSVPPPPFSLTASRFDTTTFLGRFAKQLSNCDPGTLLASRAELDRAQGLIDRFARGEVVSSSFAGKSSGAAAVEIVKDAELWDARKLAQSAIHADTREVIPQPFRMAGYVPYNGPVCVAMMVSKSTAGILFWNWTNQSQNALVNYFNRNASAPMSNETLGVSYAAAVTAALSVALGLSTLIKRNFTPEMATKLLKFVAFPASVLASSANCYIIRRPEIASGISLTDVHGGILASRTGDQIPKSSVAAKKAVTETVLSRAILQIPVFFVPAAVMSLPAVGRMCARMPGVGLPMTTLITMLSFGFGLPMAVGYFPQIGEVRVEELEKEVRERLPEGVEVVYYNKGL